MKIVKNTFDQTVLQVTDKHSSLLTVEVVSDGNLLVGIKNEGWCFIDLAQAADLARALAHFAETGRLPGPGQGDNPSLQDQITELKAYIANDEHAVQRQFEQVHERLDELEKRIKAINHNANYFLRSHDNRITRLESQVSALIKDQDDTYTWPAKSQWMTELEIKAALEAPND